MQQKGFFKTFDGTRLFYSVEGEGEPLVFCYGLVCSKLFWSYQMDYFKSRHKIIWFDYRGHHRSDLPENPEHLTIENLAKDVEALLDELNIPQATFLGHSMGVNLVLEFYRRCPDRVKAMVLANGTARGPLSTMFRSNIMQLLFPYVFAAYKKSPKIMNAIWSAQGKTKVLPWFIGQIGFNPSLAKEEDIRTYVQMVTQMDMIVTLQLLKDYENYNATSWLHKITVPTLIIAGEKDIIIPREEQEIMQQLIPNSKFEMIRNGSHVPQLDIPELVSSIIDRFLETDVYSSSSSPTSSTRSTPGRPTGESPKSTTSDAQTSRQGELSKP